LVYPKSKLKARKAILEALKEHNSPETGIGYNKLFDMVKEKIKSRATFHKYLYELIHELLVTKALDNRHMDRHAIIIFREPGSDFELQTIRLIEKLKKIFNRKDLKKIVSEEEDFINENIKIISNCIFLAHKTLAEMVPNIPKKFGKNPFIKTIAADGNIQIDFKNSNEA